MKPGQVRILSRLRTDEARESFLELEGEKEKLSLHTRACEQEGTQEDEYESESPHKVEQEWRRRMAIR